MLATLRPARVSDRVPPHVFFLVSAVSRYLGPAFAVLLFARVNVLGVAWLRIVSAAAIFALWRLPWRIAASQSGAQRTTLLALGVALGLMNVSFYQAIARLPLGTVGAIEFIGPILLALLPAAAAAIGIVILCQTPTVIEVIGILLVMSGVAVYKEGTYE